MREKILEGKLILFSEQGMEGGQLAILDNKFYQLSIPEYGLQENRKVWDINDQNKIGITSKPESFFDNSWLPARDPILTESDYQISSLYVGEEYGDLNADKRLMKKYNFRMKYTKDKANDEYGKGNWKFTGHNKDIILRNGQKIIMGGPPSCEPKRPYHIPNAKFSRVTVTWENGTIETERLSNTLLIESWSGYEALNILNETDYLKIKDLGSDRIICEGQINLIPLKTFSQTLEGHFEIINDGNNWKDYFTKEYYGELYRKTK